MPASDLQPLRSNHKRIKAQTVALESEAGVGHHWVTKGTVFHDDIRPLLSDEAVEYAMGATSGSSRPVRTTLARWLEIKHTLNTSAAVKKELKSFFKQHGIDKSKKMSGAQMKQFAQQVENGITAAGEPHPIIGPFNKAVKAAVKPGDNRAVKDG